MNGWTTRRVATATLVAGGMAFLVLAAVQVPWQPVPDGAPGPVDPRALFDDDYLAAAETYASRARLLGWSSLVVSLLVALALGFTRAGARLAGRERWPWPLRVAVATVLVLVIGRLVTLPFAILAHRHRVANGLSTQDLADWGLDVAKGLGISAVVTALLLIVLVGCARRWQTWWPAIVGFLAGAFVLAASFAYPVVIEPVFNDFESMPAGELRTGIVALAERQGVEVDEVLIADASRRTTTLNAYVSGIGSTGRVVVYDTLVESLSLDQALSVISHELAHAENRDVVTGTLLGASGAVAGVGIMALVTGAARARRWTGTTGLADPRTVALVLALLAVGGLATSPVQSGISRTMEMRADVEALAATRQPEAFVEMQRQLCRRALCDPTPPAWSQFWFGSHPTVTERVAVAVAQKVPFMES